MINKTKKKKKIKVEEEFSGVASIPTITELAPSKPKVTEFSGDFGRADINSLRDKVNEIVAFINAF